MFWVCQIKFYTFVTIRQLITWKLIKNKNSEKSFVLAFWKIQ